MRFEILHEIEYRYFSPVFFEPHLFFLRPREDGCQRLWQFRLEVNPPPVLLSWQTDPFGNAFAQGWFRGVSDYLKIQARSEVEIFRANPFDFLIDETSVKLPVHYSPEHQSVLAPCREVSSKGGSVAAFTEKIACQARDETSVFLSLLCREISRDFKVIYRESGNPWPAGETLLKKEGSCRDFAVLFMECCRLQGLAARFASGYFEGDPGKPEKELHAWCEVFLEGGGWRGWDPTHGLAVSESHVVVASASYSEGISPVVGSFRGSQASSKMTARVSMQRMSRASTV